jgi:glycosyltransferase involved in cell wall biosynthesis
MIQKQKTITVFTPTYNRAYCLQKLYNSIKRQTVKDFLWVVIDDGSTDNTKNLIDSWIKEGFVEIQYYYKENEGMHTGYNTAYEVIETELCMCIDSDDYMTDNAIELVLNHWKKYGSDKYAGIIGLDCYKDGKIISKPIPDELTETTIGELNWVLNLTGDKKLIYRTDVMKKYPPFPVFKGEKFVPLFCKPLFADRDYKMLLLKEVLCVVEYMDDGSTLNITKSYFKNPKGFAYSRKVRMEHSPSMSDRFRNAIHYISSSIITKNIKFLSESPRKGITIIAIPFGVVLYFYLLYKNKKT